MNARRRILFLFALNFLKANLEDLKNDEFFKGFAIDEPTEEELQEIIDEMEKT